MIDIILALLETIGKIIVDAAKMFSILMILISLTYIWRNTGHLYEENKRHHAIIEQQLDQIIIKLEQQ